MDVPTLHKTDTTNMYHTARVKLTVDLPTLYTTDATFVVCDVDMYLTFGEYGSRSQSVLSMYLHI